MIYNTSLIVETSFIPLYPICIPSLTRSIHWSDFCHHGFVLPILKLHITAIIWHVLLCVRLFWLSITFLKFISVAMYSSSLEKHWYYRVFITSPWMRNIPVVSRLNIPVVFIMNPSLRTFVIQTLTGPYLITFLDKCMGIDFWIIVELYV